MKKNLNLILITVLVGLVIFFYLDKDEVVETKTKTITLYDTIVKNIDNTKPNKIVRDTILIPSDTIRVEGDTIEKVIYKDLEVNKYTYKDTLETGILTSNIWADNIYKRDISLKIFKETVITETTNTIVQSNLFFGGQMNLNPVNGSIQQLTGNIYYVRKNKWLVNTGIGYNFQMGSPTVSVGFAFNF